MTDRSLLAGAAHQRLGAAGAVRTLVIVAASLLVNGCSSEPAPRPQATPVVTTLAPAPPPDPLAAPPVGGAPAAFPPSAAALPGAPAETPSAAPASAEPTPDAAAEARKKQQERLVADVAAAKAQADTLSARAATECPELKPGEMRHPGAVGTCARLRAEAAQAVSQYETLKKQAQALGIAVQ